MYVGQFRLLSLISTGQTTQIWEGIDDSDRQRYAFKTVPPDKVRDRARMVEQTQLLRHESAVGQKLHHPSVIRIFEFVELKGQPFLRMELFPVPNMKQLILQGVEGLAPLAPKIVTQAAAALAYVASQGWIHRDIKPDNFLISPEGDVKLIDFALAQRKRTGLARLFGGGSSKIQGTPSYVSPEQIRRQSLDEKSDVYSLGCTYFELMSGKRPFTGTSINELLSRHLHAAPPSLEAVNRNVSPAFSQLVQRMMAKKPADRPSVEQVGRECEGLSVFKSPPAPAV